jgi:PAS domain S-box-containing protein
MQQADDIQQGGLLEDTEAPPALASGLRRRLFWFGLGMIAVVALAAVLWVAWGLHVREREVTAHLEKRLGLMASAERQMIEELTREPKRQAARVISSELFRLYAAEVDRVEGDLPQIIAGLPTGEADADRRPELLASQLQMMQSLLSEFVQITGYQAGLIVNRSKTVYLATDAVPKSLRPEQLGLVEEVLTSGRERTGPLRYSADGLLLEVYLPIFPPESSHLGELPVSVLLLAKGVSDRLIEVRNSNLLIQEGEGVRLVQQGPDGYQEIVPSLPGQLHPVNFPAQVDAAGEMPFAPRPSLSGERQVYSLGQRLPELGWWVVAEADYQIARAGLLSHKRAVVSFAALLILFFVVTFGAVWAALAGSHDRRVARHFETLAARIDQQRQLLDRINNTISDQIVLKDLQGRYQYVNPAFAEAVGRDAGELIGQDNAAVFGFDTARRIERSDRKVIATGEAVTFNATVFLQSQRHHLQISESPLRNSEGRLTGIVSVARDVTRLIENRKSHEQATRKTVEALVRAIELSDPYLAGHSRLVGGLAVEVGKVLDLDAREIATVETAANLSQIGKLFVSRELLLKSTALTDVEKRELETHVEHAAQILRDIDFGLPVCQTVYQMNEGLNGGGYPKGLCEDEIVLPARILGAVNSFCAMVEPRAYRSFRGIDEALEILAAQPDFYDQRVVGALQEVVKSAVGDKLLLRHKNSL